MEKKAMIIVPHQDDEINLAGGVFSQLINGGYEVIVVFTLNGFTYSGKNEVRIAESLQVKQLIGYQKVYFLGYGDAFSSTHIYNSDGQEIVCTNDGHNSTYDLAGCHTYHYLKYGCQCDYTRDNYKNDLKSLILQELPNIILCVDLDIHPDHRALSLLFDEVMGEILKTFQNSYFPTILKKFAYVGVYKGKDDFFEKEMAPTFPVYWSINDEKLVWPYLWESRVRIANPIENFPAKFWKSPIYKALLAYWSQNAVTHFDKICNSDICYWYRDSSSLSYKAVVIVSSGEGAYLNDFKIVDTDDVKDDSIVILPSMSRCWTPDESDKNPFVEYIFQNQTRISTIRIYFLQEYNNPIQVSINKESSYIINNQNMTVWDIDIRKIPNSNEVVSLKFYFGNARPYVSEIEVYKEPPCFPWDITPFKQYCDVSYKRRNLVLYKLLYHLLIKIIPLLNINYWNMKLYFFKEKLSSFLMFKP